MRVLQDKSDADVLVVLTAVELSRLSRHITVVDDDTDILILLAHHDDVDKGILMFCIQLITSLAGTRKFETVYTLHTCSILM